MNLFVLEKLAAVYHAEVTLLAVTMGEKFNTHMSDVPQSGRAEMGQMNRVPGFSVLFALCVYLVLVFLAV